MVRMRNLLYGVAALAIVMNSSPDAARTALSSAASALFEATPFLFGGALLARWLGGYARIADFIGCGCGRGPSARSIPVAAATWLVFGPAVAFARYVAALVTVGLLHARSPHDEPPARERSHPLDELAALVPAAAIAGIAMQLTVAVHLDALSPILSALAGAALGFTAAPCGLGALAIAGALRIRAPVAAAGFLCIAGVLDFRALSHKRRARTGHDAFAYCLLAVANGIVAFRRGGELVHPALTAALACCAVAALAGAALYRRQRSPAARAAPVVMLAGALVGAPPPQLHVTETTLTDLFAGESVTFTGALDRERSASTIVRYAITCCRADAAPVALRLDRPPPYETGTWLRVDGTIESDKRGFFLVRRSLARVAPPADPFMYR
jgi:hypothetical protein